jgi:hypothetical protein
VGSSSQDYHTYHVRKLYISDIAYERLRQNAHELDYVRVSGVVARGINHYFAALAELEYQDIRPEYMRHTHQWSTGVNYPRQRTIKMLDRTVVQFAVIALVHGIAGYNSQNPIIDGIRTESLMSSYDNLTVLPGPVLEAIGLNWLRPVLPCPSAPPHLHRMSESDHRRMTKYRRSLRNQF